MLLQVAHQHLENNMLEHDQHNTVIYNIAMNVTIQAAYLREFSSCQYRLHNTVNIQTQI